MATHFIAKSSNKCAFFISIDPGKVIMITTTVPYHGGSNYAGQSLPAAVVLSGKWAAIKVRANGSQ